MTLARGVPTNTLRLPNAGLMLGQRLRRWPNIKPTLSEVPRLPMGLKTLKR